MMHVVRHGRTTANASSLLLGRADPDLDDVGRSQARAIAESIGTPGRLISSPLGRCVQTAEAFGVEIETDDRLAELDYGAWDLTPVAEVPAETWRHWRGDADFRPPGGETLAELADRVNGALDEWWSDGERPEGSMSRRGSGPLVVVTHVSPIKAAMAWCLGVGIDISWRSFVAQASIMSIGRSPHGAPSLRAFNLTDHLDRLAD